MLRSRSLVVPAAATLLLAGLAVPAAPPAQAAPPPSAVPKPQQYATEAADVMSARVLARLSGKRVEALSERDESATTWVNPDGSLTSELSSGPIRFQRDGKWVDVDLTLEPAADGSIIPRAHPEGLRLGGAGGTRARSMAETRTAKARTLATIGEGDQQITLQWKGGLRSVQRMNTCFRQVCRVRVAESPLGHKNVAAAPRVRTGGQACLTT
ncbi:hypothetical protein [Micromonospora radicis]|uniref:hypothetical protein n=1 Tax=Micromonospora radicis TaxID=1894971 RepID=UPI0011C459F8|nr:hypothetical protein [Micromonospora radicis]